MSKAKKKTVSQDEIDVKKSDLDKDGKLSKYEKARGKAIDKARGGNGKMPKKTNNESISVVRFLQQLSQKNYAEANKYLSEVVDSKLKTKIQTALKNKLFK
jgi:hypothetical protein